MWRRISEPIAGARDQRALLRGQRAGLEQDRVGHGDLADVVQQEAELDLRVDGDAGGVGDAQPVGGDALGVLARVGVARLDRVGEREHGGLVGAAQLLRADALLLEDLAQVGRVALELALAAARLALEAREPRAQRGDRVLAGEIARAGVHGGSRSSRGSGGTCAGHRTTRELRASKASRAAGRRSRARRSSARSSRKRTASHVRVDHRATCSRTNSVIGVSTKPGHATT